MSHITQAANEIENAVSEENVKAKDISMLLGGMVEKLQVGVSFLDTVTAKTLEYLRNSWIFKYYKF